MTILLFPEISQEKCNGCGKCIAICPLELLYIKDGAIAFLDCGVECLYCGDCEEVCPCAAIRCPFVIVVR